MRPRYGSKEDPIRCRSARSGSHFVRIKCCRAAARPVRLSVFFGWCSGLLIHTRRRGHRFRPPPSPGVSSSASSPGPARRSFFGAAAYHSTSLRLRNAVKSVSDARFRYLRTVSATTTRRVPARAVHCAVVARKRHPHIRRHRDP